MLFLVDQESEETPSELWSSRSIEGDEEKEDINETVETSLGDASTSTKSFTPTPAKMRVKIDQQEELLTLACKRLHDTDNEYAKIASVWADELRKMSPTQMLFAKKAINDILFEGQMGTLHRHSIIINTPESAPLMDSSDQ
ncbi:hypothetical protein Pcinc_014991 [Petrolisthes cinctipes]|uniref:Uncharacterized protein n=1 Tax=Petrolisthes cinctipes TaxID=88211 RepID=A0AAE1FU08_PETCI|nr:hypothetical protein Pcinc_014991 [Petrolisthes cinctipes]